ncbi:DUF932 domain-containing protein [Devosia ginsengisoli]|uniref:DUF932 domain-containing protein n=1 Tax=Devosia ginsengisoli TaxID=400770 RepID=UPI0026EE3309|nr:DUF932 domain-containing protein [Devosia ginsengisoli]MCR6673284.1 DUF945 domain-containing protein [Devosia ginsengisoli]
MTVSRQWLSRSPDQRFLSLPDLKASVDARRERSIESRINTKKIEFLAPENPTTIQQTHDLSVGLPDGTVVSPSHWSFGQLSGLAKAPAGYLRTLPSQITADALSYGMRYNREGEAVKLYAAGDELLAATGPDYGRIFDAEVVDAVMQVAGSGLGDSRWKVPGVLDWRTNTYDPEAPVTTDSTTLFASDRDVFMFLVDDRNPIEVGKLPDGNPDLMFRGFYISNSEVGSGSLRLAAFYLRAVCCNRILWGVEGFEELTMRHSKYAPSRFVEQARPALASYAEGSTRKLIEGVEQAKAAKLAQDDDDALQFLAGRGFSRKMAERVMAASEEGEGRKPRTAWDFAQGITRAAHSIPNTDARIELEGEARRLLDKVTA